jgi:predicted aminopeptidase
MGEAEGDVAGPSGPASQGGDAASPHPGEEKPGRRRRVPRSLLLAAILLPAAFLAFSCTGCSPVYVARAGLAEWKILSGRRPLGEVIADPATDPETRRKLLLARQAQAFAIHILGLKAGDQYTTYSELDTEILAWIVSAARKDRLESKTWWFPIVGRVPYRGYESREVAEKAQAELEEGGFDTYLRPTSAFSTLGWFSDPILSTFLRYDDVDLVATVLHELAHAHLWVPGNVQFNESYATFVGQAGAIRFFCGPPGTPPNPDCPAARTQWEDYQSFSVFLGDFVPRLEAIYDSATLTLDQKLSARDELLARARELWSDPSRAGGSPMTVAFLQRPVNNAILLARMRYAHQLPRFQSLLEEKGGDLAAAIARLKEGIGSVPDPFDLLPSPDSIPLPVPGGSLQSRTASPAPPSR